MTLQKGKKAEICLLLPIGEHLINLLLALDMIPREKIRGDVLLSLSHLPFFCLCPGKTKLPVLKSSSSTP
jgi:hypothetical protein